MQSLLEMYYKELIYIINMFIIDVVIFDISNEEFISSLLLLIRTK